MFEVEVKVALANPEPLRIRLADSLVREETQRDTFFGHPTRDVAATDEAIRLRETEHGRTLTYKGPRLAGETKARQEWNVACGGDVEPFMAALGCVPQVVLSKTRLVHAWQGAEVALDYVEGLGWFAEVEVLGEDVQAAAQRVEALLEALGLAAAPRLQKSYLELAIAAGSRAVTPCS